MADDIEIIPPSADERADTWWSGPAGTIASGAFRAGQIAKTITLAILVVPAVLASIMLVVGVVRGSNAQTFALVAGVLIALVLGRYAFLRHKTIEAASKRAEVTAEIRALMQAGEQRQVREIRAAMSQSKTLQYLVPPKINITGLWTLLALATTPLALLMLITVSAMTVTPN